MFLDISLYLYCFFFKTVAGALSRVWLSEQLQPGPACGYVAAFISFLLSLPEISGQG